MGDDGDFGVEGIRYFGNFRAANPQSKAVDLTYTYNITNGVYNTLRNAGYPCRFYWSGEDAWELDLQSDQLGGLDASMADDVDLFFILTHGRNDNGIISLAYNSKHDDWIATSRDWRLGDRDIEWLAIYGCSTIDRNHYADPFGLISNRLHLLLGAYDHMYDAWTTAECGEDFADCLLDGDTVKTAWIEGVGDWYVDNHPAVLSAERESTWQGGSPDWRYTTMQLDKYHGRGSGAVSDIPRSELYWVGLMWEEG